MTDVEIVDFRNLKPYYHVPGATLSEGVTYINETKTLVWVDIYKAEVHKVEHMGYPETSHDYINIAQDDYRPDAAVKYPYPDKGQHVRESIGVVFPIVEKHQTDHIERVLFASKYGIAQGNFLTKEWEYLMLYKSCPELSEERLSRLRSNDGNVSPCGKYLYIGLMNDFPYPIKDEGCILRIDLSEKTVDMVWDHMKIPNSIHWSENGDTMYVTDSLAFTIWKVDVHTKEKAKLIDVKHSNNQSFESPEPDGSSIDLRNNRLYVSVWSAGKIQEYSLADGRLLKEYLLPAKTPRISCCAIAGNDLYVTTANADIGGPKLSNDKRGGCLYKLPNVVQVSSPSALIEFASSKRQPLFD